MSWAVTATPKHQVLVSTHGTPRAGLIHQLGNPSESPLAQLIAESINQNRSGQQSSLEPDICLFFVSWQAITTNAVHWLSQAVD
ncbi:hypothetical protein ACVWWI_004007 [Bradyrhizobium sp. USDA 3686]|uniref:hypothetical protein n=1 Tax=Bradyrhizobium canariense TaxID=255045 RepID=UPI00195B331C|nr:hypothetical protein [Bradyrhizobium canariense]MBM7482681.1 hypothetical protein [Bradyrhizobium canariense]